jgi:hypothetical protein
MKCPKCEAVSGDDWGQCEGECPMSSSPHFSYSCRVRFDGSLTSAQKTWLEENTGYVLIGPPRPGVSYYDVGTLYADGTHEPSAPMKPIRLEPNARGVGKLR